MRFLCTGDLHLGAGSDLLDGDERLREQEQALGWIVDQANALDVPLLFAGDAWERRRPSPAEVLAFKRPLSRLRYRPIVVAGNHDVEAWQRPTGYDLLDRETDVATEPRIIDADDALVVCLPWATPSRLVALEGGGDRDAINVRLAEGLVDVARGLYVSATKTSPGTPVVLLTHWSISGATSSSGAPVDLFREPVLPVGALEEIGFDAVVAGHIHRPQMLGERSFYVGSPMPLNFGEADHDHVVYLLDVSPGSFQAFQIPVPSRALKSYDVVAREIGPLVGIDLPLDYDDAVVKVKIRATEEHARRLDVAAIKRELIDGRPIASGQTPKARKVWAIQVEIEREELVRGVAVDETLGDVEAMELYLDAEGHGPDRLENLLERHIAYLERLQA